MSLTCASSPAAIAVYDDTHPSTSNRGAPYRSREAYASSTVSGWYVIAPGGRRQLGRDLGERERLGARDVVGDAVVTVRVGVEQHDGRDVGDVVVRHRRDAPVARGAADHAVVAHHEREPAVVEVVAQERVPHAGGADVLLGAPVVAREREHGVRGGAHERHVDDAVDTRRDGRVHGRAVLRDAVDVLARGHEQHRVHPVNASTMPRVSVYPETTATSDSGSGSSPRLGARAASRTTRRCGAPSAASRNASFDPRSPLAPVTATRPDPAPIIISSR